MFENDDNERKIGVLISSLRWGTPEALTLNTPSGSTREVRGYGTISLEIADAESVAHAEVPADLSADALIARIRDMVISSLARSLDANPTDLSTLSSLPNDLLDAWKRNIEETLTPLGLHLLTLEVIRLQVGETALTPPLHSPGAEPPAKPASPVEPTPSTPTQQAPLSPSARTCPACLQPIPEGAKFCPSCGENIAPSCPSCGKEIPPDSRFCPWCGVKIASDRIDNG